MALETLGQGSQAGALAPRTPGAPQMGQPGATDEAQLQEVMKRLLSRAAQPRSALQAQPQQKPNMIDTNTGVARSHGEAGQMFVHNLFGLIFNSVQAQKQQQLKHATGVLSNLNNSWQKAQDLSNGDQKKAMEIFSQMPEVTHIMEDKKNVKQLGKLLQFDFMEPEKKKTVWHEALGKVVEAGRALGLTQAIQKMMKSHKDGQQDQGQYDPAKKEQEASAAAQKLAGQATPQQQDPSKVLPGLERLEATNQRLTAQRNLEDVKQEHKKEIEQMHEHWQGSIDAIKNPVDKKIAQAQLAADKGDTAEHDRLMTQAREATMAKKGPTNTLTGWISQAATGTPEERAEAEKKIAEYNKVQGSLLSQRGVAFGMGRMYQYTDDDGVLGQPGSTQVLNGFQLQDVVKGSGGHFTMIGNINPQMMLASQQVVRTALPSLKKLEGDLGAYDNAKDRAIIARLVRANPDLKARDETSIGTWINQELAPQLSQDGQNLARDISVAAETLGRIRTLSGQTSTGMNTQLILSMLPGEDTPSKAYGQAKLNNLYNLIDGLVQVPLLAGGGKATKKADQPKGDKGGRVVSLD